MPFSPHPRPAAMLLLLALMLAGARSGSQAQENPLPVASLSRENPVDFNTEIVPFLRKNCFACHNQTKAKAGLILETPADILEGGDSGPAVEPGTAESSLLFISAAHLDDTPMPPPKNKSNAVDLDPEQLALLKLWIDQGAKGTAQSAPAAPESWRHSDREPIYTLALSSDGRFAACGRGHQIHIYDLRQQKLISELVDPDLEIEAAAHRDFVHSLAFGPDGTLASGGYRKVKIWRRDDVTAIGESPSPGEHTAFAVSPDGQWCALGLADGSIRLTDQTDASAPAILVKDHAGAVNALTFLPDNATLISGSADRTLRRRSIGDFARSDPINTQAEVVSLTSVESGTRIAFGTQDNKIQLVALSAFAPAPAEDSGAAPPSIEMVELSGASAPATILRSVEIKEVEHLISAGADATVRIWNIAAKNQVHGISVGAPVAAFDVSPDGSKIIVQRSGAGPARVFKLGDGGLIKDLDLDPALSARIEAMQLDEQMHSRVANAFKTEVPKAEEFLQKERTAAEKAENDLPVAKETLVAKQAEFEKKSAAKEEAEATLQQLPEGDGKLAELQRAADNAKKELEKAEVEFTGAQRDVAALETSRQQSQKQVEELSRNLEDIKSRQFNSEAMVESLKTERELRRKQLAEEVPKLDIGGVTFFRDGSQIATAHKDGRVLFYNADDGAYLETITTRPGIAALSVDSDGQLVTHLDDGRSIRWAPPSQWSLAGEIGDGTDPTIFPDRVTALAISPDGTTLASGSGVPSRSGQLKFWSLSSFGSVAENTDAHSDTISDIEFSPDGDQVVTGSPDKFVKTFAVASGKVVRSFESHTSNVLGVAWSHDGRRLASVAADQELKIWDQETGEQVRTLKGWEQEITSVAFYSKTNEQVLTACGDRKLRLDNQVFATTDDFQHTAAVSPDGQFIVSGGEDGVLRVWDASRKLIQSFPPPHARPDDGGTAVGSR